MRLKYIAFIVSILIALFCACSTAEISPSPDLLQYVRADSSADFPSYTAPGIRIWGWAQNGRFAYSSARSVPGSGGMSVEFVVFDFIDDKQIFKLKMNDYLYGFDPASEDWKTAPESLYAKYSGQINAALAKHGIVEQQVKFLPFPLSKDGAVYAASVQVTRRDSQAGFNPIQDYNIVVTKNNEKSRIITSRNTAYVEAVAVCGYFLSPFENRALVVIACAYFGLSQTSSIEYTFSGCHLDIGF